MLNVFLTGAAGLIGGEVAARLVAAGHKVTALVHRNPRICANNGADVALDASVAGDIQQQRLGLLRGNFTNFAQKCDLVIHCAASVRFDLSDEDYTAVNVAGTANVLDFAKTAGADLLHISTAYVCGKRDGIILEEPVRADAEFANGYEASKAAGEALVRGCGLRYAIARPAIVLGDSRDGTIRSYDALYTAFKLMAQGNIANLPVTPGATLDFVPVDHVAGGIVAIAEAMDEADGGIFHLVSGGALPVGEFTAAIGSYPQFSAPQLVEAGSFDAATLPPLERRIYRRVAALYASYFQRNPRFDDSRFLALTGRRACAADTAYMRTLIDYCIADGFLPGEVESVSA